MPLYDPALEGFDQLSSALLLAPQMARRNRQDEEDRALRKQDREDTLARALRLDTERRDQQKLERDDRLAWQKQQNDRQQQSDLFNWGNMTADNGRQTVQLYKNERHQKEMERIAAAAQAAKIPKDRPTAIVEDEDGRKILVYTDNGEKVNVHDYVAPPVAAPVGPMDTPVGWERQYLVDKSQAQAPANLGQALSNEPMDAPVTSLPDNTPNPGYIFSTGIEDAAKFNASQDAPGRVSFTAPDVTAYARANNIDEATAVRILKTRGGWLVGAQ